MSDQWRFLYRARFVRAVDGDTIQMLLDDGRRRYGDEDIRVKDLWCPERGEPGYAEATAEARDWHLTVALTSPHEWPFMVELLKRPRAGDETRSLTRYVGDIYDEHLNSFANWMVANGYGTVTR